jgi:hypothetical protein
MVVPEFSSVKFFLHFFSSPLKHDDVLEIDELWNISGKSRIKGRLTTKLHEVAQSIPFSILLCDTLRYFVVFLFFPTLPHCRPVGYSAHKKSGRLRGEQVRLPESRPPSSSIRLNAVPRFLPCPAYSENRHLCRCGSGALEAHHASTPRRWFRNPKGRQHENPDCYPCCSPGFL